VSGSHRNEIYPGVNEDGTAFVLSRPSEASLNKGFAPAPSYFAMPCEDVSDFFAPTSPSEHWGIFGWSIGKDADFRSVTSDGLNNKGSYALSVVNRGSLPNPLVNNFHFDSFQYEYL
jgi:hypothetical protein